MNYALELSGVTKTYPLFTLDNITLRVPRGTIMGLIGENGAGKTTAMKVLMGITKPDGGTVSLLGETEPARMQKAKERVGVVLDGGFFPDIYKAKEIAMVCKNIFASWQGDVFDAWMRKFALPTNKKYKELSKGMKMKLSIAVALSHGAELLVLDEATSGLDPVVRSELLDILLDFMQDENHAILFPTHITSDLEQIADDITLLHKGRVVLQQNQDEILASYVALRSGAAAFDAPANGIMWASARDASATRCTSATGPPTSTRTRMR